MATFTIDIPDALLLLYRTRKTTWDEYALPVGEVGLPVLTRSLLQKWVRDYIRGLIHRESWRLDAVIDGTAEADDSLMDTLL